MSKQKLTELHVDIVRKERELGKSIKAIASELGVAHTTLIKFMRSHGISTRTVASKAQALASSDLPERYQSGATLTELKRDYAVDYATIRKALILAGVELRKTWSRNTNSQGLQRLDPDQSQRVVDLYTSGSTLEAISAEYRVSSATVRSFLLARGVSLRVRGPTAKTEREKRSTMLRRLYGISVDEYEELLEKQSGCCAICGVTAGHARNQGNKTLCVDRDHIDGRVRGLLCHRCNLGLSYFSDKPEWVANVLRYLS